MSVLLAGHRGDRAHAPENTMPSFRKAIALGVDMIETDIHMTRDGVMFIMHDDKVDRTTDGTGLTMEKTWDEISKLDAGGWFGPEFKGTPVPTLDEFCALVAETPGLWVNWELKDWAHMCGLEFALKSADGLLDCIRKYHLEERSMLNSFSAEVLEYVAEKRGVMVIHGQGLAPTDKMKGVTTKAPETYWQWACLYGTTEKLADESNFTYCRQLGIRPCVCIPDTMENYSRAVERGCEMFTSDDPETAIALLMKLGKR